MTQTTKLLSAKCKRTILKALEFHQINLLMELSITTDEDIIAKLDMDITYIAAIIKMIKT